jgi:acyl dehydratase
MQVGQIHSEHITITSKLVAEFAQVSGDFNPIHLDNEYAKNTPFGRPIAHGMLTSALLSGIMGTRFPGAGTVLLEQSIRFKKPVFVGDTVEFKISVEHVRPDKPIATFAFQILNSTGEPTSEGQIVVKLNR